MNTTPTNWMMRILLITLAVTLVLLVPAALGLSASSETRLHTETSFDAGTETTIPPADETVNQASADLTSDTQTTIDGAIDGTLEGTPLAGPVDGAVNHVQAITNGETSVNAANEGDIELFGKPVHKEDVATSGAAIVAAAGSAGALFWFKNAVGLALGRFIGAPLFSRLSKDELLENDGREMLFNLVTSNPGIGLQELADQSGLGWGTTVYHLGRLEQGGFISSMKNGQARHFFKNGHPAAKNKLAIAILKNDTASDLARFLMSTPGATQKTISAGLGIAPPTVTKYVKRLEAEGLVETLKEGRAKIVQPTSLLTEALQHVDAPMPAPVPMGPVAPHAVSAYA